MAKWSGWWEQIGLGRQKMHNLVLDVAADGSITGDGHDCIGQFALRGTFHRDGSVSLLKQYIGRHRVIYEGSNSGEGIFGHWYIPGCNTGRFALRPIVDDSADCEEIEELRGASSRLSYAAQTVS